ncbi:ABC transporter ATP-binding protein [Streptomyces sp. NRRL F-2580]|uniref:ABC transporter ATP-binding protein n=1 Tax=Streptomyces sp. NRRL F-2580 TaxID=1463841 RepID=UPI0004C754BF|nr:ATP-binding cassette domain-containing protein [Streptomyces sp. NRRL F-2580]
MLEFDALTKAFGDKKVLRGLSFQVRPGELYGFCGANGAGKTTAMRIALGMLAADTGEVRFEGRPVDSASRRLIGYMPEERGLYGKMRPRDQLVYFARLSGMGAREAKAHADEWIERLGVKMGPKDVLDKLSLGNQQKVQLIAALIHRPGVLILDEPFSGLDPVASDAMAQALTEFTRDGVPVVFSSHQLDLVERLCDRVGIVRDGALVAEGTVEELRGSTTRRLEIALEGAPAGWASAVAGARVVETRHDRYTLEVDEQVPVREILSAAQAHGDIVHFAWRESSLTEIFREAVAA